MPWIRSSCLLRSGDSDAAYETVAPFSRNLPATPQHLVNTSARSLHKRMRCRPIFPTEAHVYSNQVVGIASHSTLALLTLSLQMLQSSRLSLNPGKCHNYYCPSMIMPLASQGLRWCSLCHDTRLLFVCVSVMLFSPLFILVYNLSICLRFSASTNFPQSFAS